MSLLRVGILDDQVDNGNCCFCAMWVMNADVYQHHVRAGRRKTEWGVVGILVGISLTSTMRIGIIIVTHYECTNLNRCRICDWIGIVEVTANGSHGTHSLGSE